MEQRTKVGEFPFARDKEEDSYKNKDEAKKKRRKKVLVLALVHEIFAD